MVGSRAAAAAAGGRQAMASSDGELSLQRGRPDRGQCLQPQPGLMADSERDLLRLVRMDGGRQRQGEANRRLPADDALLLACLAPKVTPPYHPHLPQLQLNNIQASRQAS